MLFSKYTNIYFLLVLSCMPFTLHFNFQQMGLKTVFLPPPHTHTHTHPLQLIPLSFNMHM